MGKRVTFFTLTILHYNGGKTVNERMVNVLSIRFNRSSKRFGRFE